MKIHLLFTAALLRVAIAGLDAEVDAEIEPQVRQDAQICQTCPGIISTRIQARDCRLGSALDTPAACLIRLSFHIRNHDLSIDSTEMDLSLWNRRGVSISLDGRLFPPFKPCQSGLECDDTLNSLEKNEGELFSVCYETGCWAHASSVSVGEHEFSIELVTGSGARVQSPFKVPFVLMAQKRTFTSTNSSFGITVLPARLSFGTQQKIPFTSTFTNEGGIIDNGFVYEREEEYAPEAGHETDAKEAQCDAFHKALVLDLGQEQLRDQVHVGGLGNLSLNWPSDATGLHQQPNVFRVLPITYAAYDEHVRLDSLPKIYDFAPYRPGSMTAYRQLRLYGPLDEQKYFDDYSKSLFAFTRRKAGWDCMRHYEILAAGAIPYFLDLESCPNNTLASFPKDLVIQAMRMPGVHVDSTDKENTKGWIDHTVFNHTQYHLLLRQIQEWTRLHLTTSALARRLLRKMGIQDPGSAKVLYLVMPGAWPPGGTYDEGGNLRDMLFHGLRTLLGARAIDVPRIDHMYKEYLPDWKAMPRELWQREEAILRMDLHAYGFFHTGHLDGSVEVNRESIENRIKEREFDLIVMGSICHDMWARRGLDEVTADVPNEFPFWQAVKAHYPPTKVALIDGDDWTSMPCHHWNCPCTCIRRYGPYGVYFWREMHDNITCNIPS